MKAVNKDDEYKCNACKGVFIATRNHDEVSAECKTYFDTTPEETACAVICDDCWERVMKQ